MYPSISNLTTQELLSLTIRETNNDTVAQLLNHFGNLRNLAQASIIELQEVPGIGPKKAEQLLSALELARRIYMVTPEGRTVIQSPQDVFDLLHAEMRFLDREYFKTIALNTKHHVLAVETVSIGSLNSTIVHPREVFKNPIKLSAAAIILVHNHPSTDTNLSREDGDITKRLAEAGKILGIEVLDHVIIGDGNYTSLKERGLL